MSKDELDIDEKIEKIARKTNINIQKTEYVFENQIKRLNQDIENIINNKIKDFDDNKKLSSEYLTIDYESSTIENYRNKLKKL